MHSVVKIIIVHACDIIAHINNRKFKLIGYEVVTYIDA